MSVIEELKKRIDSAEAVLIGAGAGLSASAGYTYSGDRFENHFADFIGKYGFPDMYSAGFYPFPSQEEFWAFWSRVIYYERYSDVPKTQVFADLLSLVKDKDYFVITTNVDHMFQRTGFKKERLFYTQGDYGLWQCKKPCHQKTYDNKEAVMMMFNLQRDMKIPSDLIPGCPKCGGVMYPNLRCGDWFVQDEGWHAAADRYEAWVNAHKDGDILFFDLGSGMNTPAIFKYPFMCMTYANKHATYATINFGEAFAARDIQKQSICINDDIGNALHSLMET